MTGPGDQDPGDQEPEEHAPGSQVPHSHHQSDVLRRRVLVREARRAERIGLRARQEQQEREMAERAERQAELLNDVWWDPSAYQQQRRREAAERATQRVAGEEVSQQPEQPDPIPSGRPPSREGRDGEPRFGDFPRVEALEVSQEPGPDAGEQVVDTGRGRSRGRRTREADSGLGSGASSSRAREPSISPEREKSRSRARETRGSREDWEAGIEAHFAEVEARRLARARERSRSRERDRGNEGLGDQGNEGPEL